MRILIYLYPLVQSCHKLHAYLVQVDEICQTIPKLFNHTMPLIDIKEDIEKQPTFLRSNAQLIQYRLNVKSSATGCC